MPNYVSYVKTQHRPTLKGRKLMGVTAARVKTEKSKRRPGKSAHVAVDVKPAGAAVHAATIRSKEVASCYSRPNSVSSTPAVQFAPLPSRLSRPRRPDAGRERSRLDSQILGKPEPTGPSRRTAPVCLGPM